MITTVQSQLMTPTFHPTAYALPPPPSQSTSQNGKSFRSLTIFNQQPQDLMDFQHGLLDWEPQYSTNRLLICSISPLPPLGYCAKPMEASHNPTYSQSLP